jgi:hypothetical protein
VGAPPLLKHIKSPIDVKAFSFPAPFPLSKKTSPVQRQKFRRNVRIANAHNNLIPLLKKSGRILAVEVTLTHEKNRPNKEPRCLGRIAHRELAMSLPYFTYLMMHANGPGVFHDSLNQSPPSANTFTVTDEWREQYIVGPHLGHPGPSKPPQRQTTQV